MTRKSSLFQSSERSLALEEVLRWLKEVLKWLKEVLKWLEVLNLPPNCSCRYPQNQRHLVFKFGTLSWVNNNKVKKPVLPKPAGPADLDALSSSKT